METGSAVRDRSLIMNIRSRLFFGEFENSSVHDVIKLVCCFAERKGRVISNSFVIN